MSVASSHLLLPLLRASRLILVPALVLGLGPRVLAADLEHERCLCVDGRLDLDVDKTETFAVGLMRGSAQE